MPIKPSQLDYLGASLTDNEVVFTHENPIDNSVCILNTRGFVGIAGPDAEKFMQGQLTCDVEAISENLSSLGAHCTPKGRALASFRLVKTADQHYLFSLPENNTDTLRTSLGKYIVFSKAKLSAIDNTLALGLNGSKAAAFINEHFSDVSDTHSSASNSKGTAINVGQDRFELWLNDEQLQALWPAITAEFKTSNTNAWYSANIDAGLVEIEAASSDVFIPQMFKLEEHGGISFSKGCYTGQEIVARLKYLGKQKRQLAKFTHSNNTINVGDKVESNEGQNLGTVAANTGLAVVSDQALEADAATINSAAVSFNHGE